jgi:hypothetical protein
MIIILIEIIIIIELNRSSVKPPSRKSSIGAVGINQNPGSYDRLYPACLTYVLYAKPLSILYAPTPSSPSVLMDVAAHKRIRHG